MKTRKNLVIIILMIILAGCATISHGPLEEVSLSGNKDSVDVYINNKNIGQMPVSVELWKAGIHRVAFRLPDGQEYRRNLKTKPSAEMLKNGPFFFVYIPLGLGMFGVDFISGSGLSFKEEMLSFGTENTDSTLTIQITTKRKKPQEYVLVSAGYAQCRFDMHEEEDENYSRVNIPEIFIEFTRTFREIYHIGYGINLQYQRDMGNDDNITLLPAYLILKASPLPKVLGCTCYGVLHGGFAYSWGMKEGELRFSVFPNFYGACGFGMNYNNRLYSEVLWRSIVNVHTLERMDLHSVVLRLGVRFEL